MQIQMLSTYVDCRREERTRDYFDIFEKIAHTKNKRQLQNSVHPKPWLLYANSSNRDNLRTRYGHKAFSGRLNVIPCR